MSALATAGPRLPGAGRGRRVRPGSIDHGVRPLNPACAIFRNTRSSAAVQGSRPALPAGSSPKVEGALLVAVVDVPTQAIVVRPWLTWARDSFAPGRRPSPRGRRPGGCEASNRSGARQPSARRSVAASRRSIRTRRWPSPVPAIAKERLPLRRWRSRRARSDDAKQQRGHRRARQGLPGTGLEGVPHHALRYR